MCGTKTRKERFYHISFERISYLCTGFGGSFVTGSAKRCVSENEIRLGRLQITQPSLPQMQLKRHACFTFELNISSMP